MIAGVDLFVHAEAVQIRILRSGAQIARNDDAHVAHTDALFAAPADVFLNRVEVDLHFDAVRRVIAFRHDVRHQLVHSVVSPYAVSVCSIHARPPLVSV